MKASKFVVLAGGILGLIAFFLPLLSIPVDNNQTVRVSAFQVVRGVDGLVDAAGVKEEIASLDLDSRKLLDAGDHEELGAMKKLVFAIFLPAGLIALIGVLGVARKKFGRLAGTFALLLGLVTLGVGALMRSAANESGTSAGIAITVLLLTGLLAFAGGIMALAKPERALARA